MQEFAKGSGSLADNPEYMLECLQIDIVRQRSAAMEDAEVPSYTALGKLRKRKRKSRSGGN